MKFVAVNFRDNSFVTGESIREIVNQIFEWRLDEDRVLYAKSKGFKEYKFHSYSEEFNQEHLEFDIISTLRDKMPLFGWTLYIDYNAK